MDFINSVISFYNNLPSSVKDYLSQIGFLMVSFVVAVTFHEWAHAYMAYKLGDTTAKERGFVTLSPFKHIRFRDVPQVVFTGFLGGKQGVPFDAEGMYVSKRAGTFLVSIAGMLVNLILAILTYTIMKYLKIVSPGSQEILRLLNVFFQTNTILILVNAVPFPPTDGFKVIATLMPKPIMHTLVGINWGDKILAFAVFIFGWFKFGSPLRLLAHYSQPIRDVLIQAVDFLFKLIFNRP